MSKDTKYTLEIHKSQCIVTKESYLLWCYESYVFYSVKVVKRKGRLLGNKTIRKAPVE